MRDTCSIEGCERARWARGWCSTHYQRWRNHGDPLPDVPVAQMLTRDEMLDRHVVKSDGCWRWTGTVSKWTGYATIGNIGVHRMMWERAHGSIPDGVVVDHRCHNEAARRGECGGGPSCIHRQCVNPAHMVLVTHGENLAASPLTTNGNGRTLCGMDDCGLASNRWSGYCNKHHNRWETYGDPAVVPERLTRPAVCIVEGCGKRHHAKGYCDVHAARVRAHGDPHVVKKPQTASRPDVCTVDGCGRPHRARGWCGSHWYRWRKHGDVLADVPIGGDR